MSPELAHKMVLIQRINHPSIFQRGTQVKPFNLDINFACDWMVNKEKVLEFPGEYFTYGLKIQALNYILVEGDLYRKRLDGFLLRCVGFPKALEIMKQVHEGVCGSHQLGVNMRWLIRIYGYC